MVNLMHILVPLYMYPSNCATNPKSTGVNGCTWTPFFTAIEANKQVMFTIVVNPASGPGPNYTYPDANWMSVIAQTNSYNNTRTIGYIDSNPATIPPSQYIPAIKTYANWANYTAKDIHMDGVFVDDMDGQTSNLGYYVNYANNIKTYLPSSAEKYICVNPGSPIDCNFYGNVSTVITFEDYYYNLANAPFKSSQYNACPRVKQTVIVHDFTGTATDQQQVCDDMGETYRIGNLYITSSVQNDTANPYDKVPPLWSQFAASVSATDSWIAAHPQWYSP